LKPLTAEKAARLLRQMHGQRVLVAGDVMLDEFLWGSVSRISPEAPVPVVKVTRHSYHLGGAGNVAGNVRALGGEAVVVGVVGGDEAGQRIRAALAQAGVEDGLAVAEDGRPTTVKARIVAHQQQVVRADRELAEDVPPAVEADLMERLRAALPSCGALVISDYQKGVVTPRLMKALLPLARRHGVPVLVDPKVRHFALYRKVTVVTPNQLEAEQATGRPIRTVEDLRAAGQRILRTLSCDAVLVTRGEHGMALFPRQGRPVMIPTAAREVYDVTGAGDTVIATLALAVCAGAGLAQAAALANHAAGVVVGKVGTATASPQEVLAALEGRTG
jgi:D-beta-D-heptose 7-phosphate kinase/D-beta-D-heptose 1-phosphate adenosyltransferase